MSRVINICPIGKKKNKVNVFLEGEDVPLTACTLAVEKLRIREGIELDATKKLSLIRESAVIEGFERAVKFVISRPRSEKEVRLFLLKKSSHKSNDDGSILESESYFDSGIETDDVTEEIINKLIEYRYIDDEAFAKAYINHYKSVRGQKLLRYELSKLGVEAYIIDEVFSQFDGQFDEAFCLAEKWIRGKKEIDFYKLNSYLYSKGFDSDEIKSAIERIKEERSL